jgi:putative DNA primase/helicase
MTTATATKPDRETEGRPVKHGPASGVRFVCVDLDLAEQMQRVAFPSLCNVHDSGSFKQSLERNTVVVLHLGRKSLTQALLAAENIQNRYWPERVGTLDLTTMRFAGAPNDFVAWWTSELEGNYESGADFVQEAQTRTKWLRKASDRPSEAKGLEGYGTATDEELGIVAADRVAEAPIDWLWPYRFARGEMALLAGDGGLGKSSLLLAIAAMITRGQEWPDKSGRAPVGSVAIVSAEDSRETTLKPRLMALGADLTRIRFVTAKMTIQKPGEPPMVSPMTLSDRPYWKEVLKRIPDCRMLIVDPIPSYLGRGVNDSKNSELRAVIEPFLELVARPAGICFVANSHLNKSIDSKTPMHRITGSMAYGNLPRNVHFVVADPDNPARAIFKQGKCNNAPKNLAAIAYELVKTIIPSAAGEIETSYPVFDPETVQVDLAEAMGGGKAKRGPDPAKTAQVSEWLVEYLEAQAGPAAFRDVINAAGEQGFAGDLKPNSEGYLRWSNPRILYMAKDAVNLNSRKGGEWMIEDIKCGKVVSWSLVPSANTETQENCKPSKQSIF